MGIQKRSIRGLRQRRAAQPSPTRRQDHKSPRAGKGSAMAYPRPLKRDRKVAADLLDQIEHLTARWHLNFSEVELTVIRRALASITSGKAGEK